MKLKLVAILSVTAVSMALYAAPTPSKVKASVTEAPIAMQKGSSTRLFIVGFAGQVVVTPDYKSNQITVRSVKYIEGDSLPGQSIDPQEALRQLVVKITSLGSTAEVRAQLPPTRTDWSRWVRGKEIPQVKMEISAPPQMNLEIYWTRGDVKVSGWKAPVVITSQEGHLNVNDVTGDVIVRSMFGSNKIENIKGALSLENFSSQTSVTNVTGKVKMRTFSGDTALKKVVGSVVFSTQKAPSLLSEIQGDLEVQTGIAPLKIFEHKGAIKGQAESGQIDARIKTGQVDVKLTSVTGDISVSVPRTSKASVAMSTKGDLVAPKSLERKRNVEGKVVRGDLQGNESGIVRLSSDSGDLTLKSL